MQYASPSHGNYTASYSCYSYGGRRPCFLNIQLQLPGMLWNAEVRISNSNLSKFLVQSNAALGSPWPLDLHPPSFPHIQLNTHTHTHSRSISASLITVLFCTVIGISCKWRSPRWQLHKAFDRHLRMRQFRSEDVQLLNIPPFLPFWTSDAV